MTTATVKTAPKSTESANARRERVRTFKRLVKEGWTPIDLPDGNRAVWSGSHWHRLIA